MDQFQLIRLKSPILEDKQLGAVHFFCLSICNLADETRNVQPFSKKSRQVGLGRQV